MKQYAIHEYDIVVEVNDLCKQGAIDEVLSFDDDGACAGLKGVLPTPMVLQDDGTWKQWAIPEKATHHVSDSNCYCGPYVFLL